MKAIGERIRRIEPDAMFVRKAPRRPIVEHRVSGHGTRLGFAGTFVACGRWIAERGPAADRVLAERDDDVEICPICFPG